MIRYGQLDGPGTFYEDRLSPHPRIHVRAAAPGGAPAQQALQARGDASPGTEAFYRKLGFLHMNTAMAIWHDPAHAIGSGLLSPQP